MSLSDNERLKAEHLALKEFNANKTIQSIPFDFNSEQFILSTGKVVKLNDLECPNKKLIFASLNYIHYLLYQTDEMFNSSEKHFIGNVNTFVDFLNDIHLDEKYRSKILKEYETYRVEQGVKTQSTGIVQLKTFFAKSIQYQQFTENLTTSQINLLHVISDTKAAPKSESDIYTLTNWFSHHTWLRRSDIGVGPDLYSRLGSPKAVINSFNISIEVGLLKIQKIKYDLIEFFKKNQDAFIDFTPWSKKGDFSNGDAFKLHKTTHANEMINLIRQVYHQREQSTGTLKGIEIILTSLVNKTALEATRLAFFKNEPIAPNHSCRQRCLASEAPLFSINFLSQLVQYARNMENQACPVSYLEHILFQWIMASLRVQPSDVAKLTTSNFSLAKNKKREVKLIECNYFKGRAQGYYGTETIFINTNRGESILNFINDRSAFLTNSGTTLTYKIDQLYFSSVGITGLIFKALTSDVIIEPIEEEHAKQGVVELFLKTMKVILSNSYSFDSYKKKHKILSSPEARNDWLKTSNYCRSKLFGLASVKNTAVHAKSDHYDPTKLLNFNSHTNQTERLSYLTTENIEWMNNAGRITRAVMQDIHNNLYQLSNEELNNFYSEFTKCLELIDIKKEETLCRLKTLTGQRDGEVVDEVGIKNVKEVMEGDLPDSIYLVDSPESVMKLKHYISESEKHHQRILKQNPEFLFNNLLPTLEWIEVVFDKGMFSTSSISKGEDMFNRFGHYLPPIFAAHGGD